MESIVKFNWIEKSGKKGKFTLFNNDYRGGKLLNFLTRFLPSTLKIKELGEAFGHFQKNMDVSKPYFQQFVHAFQLQVENYGSPISNIKKEGPIIFYANHPLSGVDAFAIASEVEKVRPDIKVFFSYYLATLPNLANHAFLVDIHKDDKARAANQVVFEEVREHIRNGKSILIFPSGSISRWINGDRTRAIDSIWHKGMINFAKENEATAFFPVYVDGEPSQRYLEIRSWSKVLASLYVFAEFGNQIASTLKLVFGKAIEQSELNHMAQEEKVTYLRKVLYDLQA